MQDIFGTWKMVRAVAVNDAGEARPPPFGGETALARLVLRADGRMVAVLCDSRTDLPPDAPRAYSSYCGAFTFDGARLVTRVDAAADPARLGTDQVRKVHFEGDLMVLQPPPREVDGERRHWSLFWRRISED